MRRWSVVAAACVLALLACSAEALRRMDEASFLEKKGKKGAKRAKGPPKAGMIGGMPATSGKAAVLPDHDSQCVMCQYLVERIRGEMLMNGIGGGLPFGQTPPMVGVPAFSVGGVPSNVPNPAAFFSPPVAAGPGTGAANAPGAAAAVEQAPVFLETASTTKKRRGGGLKTKAKKVLQSLLARAARSATFNKLLGWAKKDKNTKRGMNRSIHRLSYMHRARIPYPRRDSKLVLRHFRPPQIRYADMYDGPLRSAKRAQERFENNQMNTVVFETLRDICAKHVPGSFTKYCFPILKNYQKIAEGLFYKDRPDAICMQIDSCNSLSYIRKSPHAIVSP